MKKMSVVVLSVVVVLALVLPVLAAEQKAEISGVDKAYIETLKADVAYIDALAEAGQISAEQADYAKKLIQAKIEYLQTGDSAGSAQYGYGPMHGNGMMGYYHGGMMGGSSMPCGQ